MIALDDVLAQENRDLRADNIALRSALNRATVERDQWRGKYQDAAFRMAQFKLAVGKLLKEAV